MRYNINEHIVSKLINKYGGSERKESILLDDDNEYLLKLPDPAREVHLSLSYINNAISEYLGCKIIKDIGLPVQDVILGEYTTRSSSGTDKTYIACACKNLATDGYSLAEAEKTSLGSDGNTKEATIPSFSTLEKIAKYTPDISEQEIREFYSNQFVADAFIGNRDRHNGNWGFLTSKHGNKISPIYDCGSSLCPLYHDEELSEKTAVNEAYNDISAIRDKDGNQIKYRSFLMSGENEDVNSALKRIVPRINMANIEQIIYDTPYISERRRTFYMTFLDTKYQNILLPALDNLLTHDINHQLKTSDTPEDIYQTYSAVIKQWTLLPMFERSRWNINGYSREIMRVGKKYLLFIDPNSQETTDVIISRSNNKEAYISLQKLSIRYGTDITKLKDRITREDSLHINEQCAMPIKQENEIAPRRRR